MRKMFRKTITLALSAMLALQVSASAELFIDNPVETDGKTSVKVANYAEEPQKVRLYTATYEGEKLSGISISKEETVAVGSSVELTTNATGVNYFWSDALVPYDTDAVELATPTNLTAPASRDSASNHRTWAYNSFLLEWDLDTTGIVDHYEVYANGTKIGETGNGYYIVYVDDVNEDSKNYTVKAVTAGGKESDTSATVSAGSLYMNEIDFSNMVVDAEAETVYDVTYYNLNSNNGSIDTSVYRYATTDDDKTVTKHWVDENTAGVEATGMKMLVGELGSSQYAVPVKVQDANGNVQSAFKSYFTGYSKSAANNNTMYLYFEDDYLTLNETDTAPHANISFEWDYFDNKDAKIGSRYDKTLGGNEYLGGGDKSGSGTNLWKTNSGSKTNYNERKYYTDYAYDGITPNARIFTNYGYPSADTVAANPDGETKQAKTYLSGVRAWLTDRMRSNDWTETEKRQNVSGTFAGVKDVIADGLSVKTFSGSQRRSTSDLGSNITAGAYMTVGSGTQANIIAFNVDDTYLSKYDKNVTIEFDYYINAKNTETFDVVVSYTDKEGTTKKHTQAFPGGEGTAKITLTDAGFNNLIYDCDFTVEPGVNTQLLYILNMDVHASNNVK